MFETVDPVVSAIAIRCAAHIMKYPRMKLPVILMKRTGHGNWSGCDTDSFAATRLMRNRKFAPATAPTDTQTISRMRLLPSQCSKRFAPRPALEDYNIGSMRLRVLSSLFFFIICTVGALSSQEPSKLTQASDPSTTAVPAHTTSITQPSNATASETNGNGDSGNCSTRSLRLKSMPCSMQPPIDPGPPIDTNGPLPTPIPTASEIKQAETLYQNALRLESDHQFDDAVLALNEAITLNPANMGYVAAQEYMKQESVSAHIHAGDNEMFQGRKVMAAAQYRTALMMSPQDPTALQRLKSVYEKNMKENDYEFQETELGEETELQPKPGKQEVHYRGDARGLFDQIGRQFQIAVRFDNILSKNIVFDMEAQDFATVMRVANKLTHTFFVVDDVKEIRIGDNSEDTRRRLEHNSLRTFYLPTHEDKEVAELETLMKTTFDLRFIKSNAVEQTLTVRAPRHTLDAIGRILESLSAGPPDVIFEFEVLEVNSSMMRNIGINLPLQYSVFNVATEANKLLQSAQGSSLLQQLQASGANANLLAGAAALLAASSGSPLSQPFATIGGGITLTGIGIPALSANFQFNRSDFKSLTRLTVHTEQGSAANFRVGDRYPVLTQSFGSALPVRGAATSSQGSFLQVPGFQYEDLGITFKVTPSVDVNNLVTMNMELSIKALAGVSFNGVPEITNREFKSVVSLKNGAPAVVMGYMTHDEQNSMSGLPLLSKIPLLGAAVSSRGKQDKTTNLLIVIIPHVVRAGRLNDKQAEIYLDGN
jgi:general secretion pathway protein D